MVAIEPLTGARIPDTSDGPLGGLQIGNVVRDIVPYTTPSFTDAAARNAAFSSWVADGGVMRKGLVSHTRSDDRFWRYDGAAWLYNGGAPPPVVACTPSTGWNAVSSNPPGVYRDASGLIHFVGAVTPVNTYDPTASVYEVLRVPAGFVPAGVSFVNLIVPGTGSAIVVGRVEIDGALNIVGGTRTSIASGAGHFLTTATPYHPTYNLALPFP